MKLLIKHVLHFGTYELVIFIVFHINFIAVGVSFLLLIDEIFAVMICFSRENQHLYQEKPIQHNIHDVDVHKWLAGADSAEIYSYTVPLSAFATTLWAKV